MPFLIFFGLSAIGIFYLSSGEVTEMITGKKLYDLPDVDPANQGGNYKDDYDVIFESVSKSTGVPFALLKAHAIQESSLNPRAFTDENPQKTADRSGWASRGLMQILAWPGTTRLVQFGFTSDDLFDSVQGDLGKLYDPYTNVKIGAAIIASNLRSCGGNLRDAVNMYNAGVKESVRKAPLGYVDKVLGYYSTLIGKDVS